MRQNQMSDAEFVITFIKAFAKHTHMVMILKKHEQYREACWKQYVYIFAVYFDFILKGWGLFLL